jgi:hypothetical protein
MTNRTILGLTALVCCAAAAQALVSSHADPLGAWVAQRGIDLRNPVTKTERKQVKALDRATGRLATETETLVDDAKVGWKTVAALEKPFAGDGELGPILGTLGDAFESDVGTRRTSLGAIGPLLQSDQVGTRLAKDLGKVDTLVAKSENAKNATKRMKFLFKAFKKLGKAEDRAARDFSEGNDRFVHVGGANNLPARAFIPVRQTDTNSLIVTAGGKVRTEWENGDAAAQVGNYLLIINWTDESQNTVVDKAVVNLFRRIGTGESAMAWFMTTEQVSLADRGISIDETAEGTRVSFDGVRLDPTVAATNAASGPVFLTGRLLIDLE